MTSWKTSDGRSGDEWVRENRDRIMELNDMLFATDSMDERRRLFKTFTLDERHGLMDEYIDRKTDLEAPVGSLVRPSSEKSGIHFEALTHDGTRTFASQHGLAIVIGAGSHGSRVRHVMLVPPWENQEGMRIYFATTNTSQLTVIKEET